MQAHIDKFWMIAYQLANIDHQVSNEDLAFTLLKSLPPSFHTFVVSLNTYIDQIVYGVSMWTIVAKIIVM